MFRAEPFFFQSYEKIIIYPVDKSCRDPYGCIAEDRSACPHPRGVSVRLTVCPDPMTAVTRTTDEEALRDLNLYLYDDDGEIVLHRYQSSSTLRFTSLPGNYLLRIAANMGRDLGENPASEDFTVTHADEYDTLPMSYEGDVTITSSSGGILTLPVVEVPACRDRRYPTISPSNPQTSSFAPVQLWFRAACGVGLRRGGPAVGRPRRLHGLPGKRDFGTAYFGELLSASEYAGHGSVHYRPAR